MRLLIIFVVCFLATLAIGAVAHAVYPPYEISYAVSNAIGSSIGVSFAIWVLKI